jgi:hypothetical protein
MGSKDGFLSYLQLQYAKANVDDTLTFQSESDLDFFCTRMQTTKHLLSCVSSENYPIL